MVTSPEQISQLVSRCGGDVAEGTPLDSWLQHHSSVALSIGWWSTLPLLHNGPGVAWASSSLEETVCMWYYMCLLRNAIPEFLKICHYANSYTLVWNKVPCMDNLYLDCPGHAWPPAVCSWIASVVAEGTPYRCGGDTCLSSCHSFSVSSSLGSWCLAKSPLYLSEALQFWQRSGLSGHYSTNLFMSVHHIGELFKLYHFIPDNCSIVNKLQSYKCIACVPMYAIPNINHPW